MGKTHLVPLKCFNRNIYRNNVISFGFKQEIKIFPRKYYLRNRSSRGFFLSWRQEAEASRVHLLCNLQSRARTHGVLMIGLHELLGNPTT
jgi:hypothetical protein